MSIAELRLQLHQVIDTLTDKEQMEAVYTLIKGSSNSLKQMSVEEYVGAIDEAKQQIKDGQFMSHEQFEKESENW